MNTHVKLMLMAMLCVAAAGCARTSAEQTPATSNHDYLLAAEPAGAVHVLNVKDQAANGEPVVVVGRIGGGVKPWIDGRAAFLLVDERIQSVCEEGDQCEDGCTHCAQELAEATTVVKFLDEQNKVLPVDARELLGVKESQTVVVRGFANRDESGNVSIEADGIYVRR